MQGVARGMDASVVLAAAHWPNDSVSEWPELSVCGCRVAACLCEDAPFGNSNIVYLQMRCFAFRTTYTWSHLGICHDPMNAPEPHAL